ncbi:MAG: CPBP family intramembrane metalloprotease [Anaerolineae bacterium]|nr:CPBP family intramembrane metalloprotease [Anaerolineae bacterium]MBT4309234.1 CPBP family intramembrane metalloprotease [Anaerolineae bacterium]MBT4458535.1 CPBP family intramembrane metalloprotease [Anaerolineae bacterium]MBT4842711.1 CPBP family intramembrane metalloprotease [Anaerolineae bacterium]MBT6062046.1 CPBP family intramembrane metalloprotease [Anaerolineae bacterium]
MTFQIKPSLDWKIATITILSTTLLILDDYHLFTSSKLIDRNILYLLIPLFTIIFIFRESPARYGFQFGDWREGLKLTILAILLMTPILWWLLRANTGMQDYYAYLAPGLPWNTFLDLLGWEFLFRGFLLFGYARKFGDDALWIQAVPFALAHIDKPEIETLSTIFGGFVFGWIAWRSKSFLYPFLIHWYIGSLTILLAAGILG